MCMNGIMFTPDGEATSPVTVVVVGTWWVHGGYMVGT